MGELVPAQAGGAAGSRLAVAATAVRGLSRFAIRGVSRPAEFLLDYDVIEAFCVPACPAARRPPGHLPVGAVPAREAGARRAGSATPFARQRRPYSRRAALRLAVSTSFGPTYYFDSAPPGLSWLWRAVIVLL